MTNLRYATLLLAVSLAAFQESAPRPERAKYDVHILACVRRGVEAGCLIVTDAKTGQAYDITAAPSQSPPDGGAPEKPKADLLMVDLYGNVCKDCMGTCMQGVILKDIKWRYTRRRCPLPRRKRLGPRASAGAPAL
ncbi:MAG TPA: hypothetical protein VJN43_11070 [Bryobacteraceae bacterium]|nr:hypothetical protein [Bryobacteraceae bacterium]